MIATQFRIALRIERQTYDYWSPHLIEKSAENDSEQFAIVSRFGQSGEFLTVSLVKSSELSDFDRMGKGVEASVMGQLIGRGGYHGADALSFILCRNMPIEGKCPGTFLPAEGLATVFERDADLRVQITGKQAHRIETRKKAKLVFDMPHPPQFWPGASAWTLHGQQIAWGGQMIFQNEVI